MYYMHIYIDYFIHKITDTFVYFFRHLQKSVAAIFRGHRHATASFHHAH